MLGVYSLVEQWIPQVYVRAWGEGRGEREEEGKSVMQGRAWGEDEESGAVLCTRRRQERSAG